MSVQTATKTITSSFTTLGTPSFEKVLDMKQHYANKFAEDVAKSNTKLPMDPFGWFKTWWGTEPDNVTLNDDGTLSLIKKEEK